MGIKTSHAALSYALSHVQAAAKQSQNVNSLHAEIQLQLTEVIRNMQLLVSSAQVGDANITTINNLISSLS
jgi:hypothetical protein